MKITVGKVKTSEKAKFICGDFFLTDNGAVRQIVETKCHNYAVINPKNGNSISVSKKTTAQAVAEEYVREYGTIIKLGNVELILDPTGEVLKRGMLQ